MMTELMNVIGYTVAMIALGFALGYPIGYIVGKLDIKK